ncbi:MAG: aminotransferase class I/II-fold pyridoxal phosphate-dependent enzyme [Pseudomonadaceae bacterium]|nr:aminotransferase class I/II-fold pyridoxal phosphate-dependent enzyme [Pseudomonadaceae bacterium]
MLQQLTDYELVGLQGDFNLSDGHAYHDINDSFPSFPSRLSEIWRDSELTKVNIAESRFKIALAKLIGSETLEASNCYKISPTSSNSIDLVAAYLAAEAPRVLLVEPTFDNLALLLRRRGCKLQSIDDAIFSDLYRTPELFSLLDLLHFDTIFLVNPNNPTGTVIDQKYFGLIAEYCAHRNKVLVLDTTFRMYVINQYDERAQLEKSGCRYFIIEDTGKTWPTHDLKASLISYSFSCAKKFEKIYDEVYLCHSRFAMLIFESLFDLTRIKGIVPSIQTPVNTRHAYLTKQLSNSIVQPKTDRTRATLPLEWFELKACSRFTDIDIVNYFAEKNVHVLPGSFFYWSKKKPPYTAFRVSLSRPELKFQASVDKLKSAINHFEEDYMKEVSDVLA